MGNTESTLPKGWPPGKKYAELTRAERQNIQALNPPEIVNMIVAGFYFDWAQAAVGFGQLHVGFDPDTGAISCANERMPREQVRTILHAMADFIADRCTLSDNPNDLPPIDPIAERLAILEEERQWNESMTIKKTEKSE